MPRFSRRRARMERESMITLLILFGNLLIGVPTVGAHRVAYAARTMNATLANPKIRSVHTCQISVVYHFLVWLSSQ